MSYIDVLNDAAARADAASTKAEGASQLLEDIANGPEGSYVTTLNGQVPTAATAIDDLTTQITSGVLAPISEEVTLTGGQTQVTFNNLDTAGLSVYINEGSGAYRYFNFTVSSSNSITLGDSFGAGTVLWGVAQEIGGEVQTAVQQTQANAQLAEDWAILTGQPVDGTEYSAKHYSEESALSASDAATSEQNAAQSASNAATSEQNAAQTLDDFDDRFLGSKSTEPTTDNDGDALIEGAVYWDSNEKNLKYWNGTSWQTWTDATQISNDDSGQSMTAPTVQDAIDTLDNTTVELDTTDKNIVKLNRSLQRSGDNGQTIHADFAYGAYGLGSRMSIGVDEAMSGEDLFTVERATPKWVFGPNGKLREVPPNTLARQWNPATGEPEGVLIEESRTNLMVPSISPDRTPVGITLDSETPISLEGVELISYIETPSSGSHFTNTPNVTRVAGKTYTETFFAASSGRQIYVFTSADVWGGSTSARFNLDTGTVESANNTTAKMTRVSDRVWRCEFTVTAEEDGEASWRLYLHDGFSFSYEGDGVSGVFIGGLQSEEGSTPSSYIPTEDAPVTRASDQVSRELGEEFNPMEGTFVFDVSTDDPIDKNNYLFWIGRGSGGITEDSILFWRPRNLSARLQVFSSGSLQATISNPFPADMSGKNRIGFSYKPGQLTATYNGGAAVTVSMANTPPMDLMRLFRSQTVNYSGIVKELDYIPRALSEAELIELTS